MDGPPVFAQVLCVVFALQSAFLETAAQFHVYVPLTYGLWKMKKNDKILFSTAGVFLEPSTYMINITHKCKYQDQKAVRKIRTLMPCPSVVPKRLLTCPNCFGTVKIILD